MTYTFTFTYSSGEGDSSTPFSRLMLMGLTIKILNLAISVFVFCQIFPETLSWKTYFSQWIRTRLIVPAWMKGSSLSTVKVNKRVFSITREAALQNRFICTQSINKAELVFRRGEGGGGDSRSCLWARKTFENPTRPKQS